MAIQLRLRRVATGLFLMAAATSGCTSGGGALGGGSTAPSTAEPVSTAPEQTIPATTVPSTSRLDISDPCTYLEDVVTSGLTRWTGSEDILSAPIAGTRLGPQPDGGVPGVLVNGCIWEAHGPNGGHIAVAVERFTDVDIDALMAMSVAATVTPRTLASGLTRWDVPPSGDSPSGAVLVLSGTQLVVIRVESHSDNLDRTFLIGTLEGSEQFFRAVGDAVEASSW